MEDYVATSMAEIATQLTVLATKNIAGVVSAKFKALKNEKKVEELRNAYEDLINELVSERAQAISIAQAYQTEVNRYEITDADIEHLQQTVSAILDIVKSFSPDAGKASLDAYNQFKSLLSVDTLKAVQLLGFDYKKAIGDPLTEVCSEAIRVNLGSINARSQRDGRKRH